MDQTRAPLLEALAEYHELDRYGFTPPGIVKGGEPILGCSR
jgi:arginine decarboxylase